MTPQELKNSILQLAIQGKLVEQRPEEGIAEVPAAPKHGGREARRHGEIEPPFDIPDSWRWVSVGELFQHNTGKALNSADTDGTPLEYITTSNVYWNRFDLGKLKTMRFTDAEVEKCTVRKGDLLVLEGGDIGRAAIWNFDFPMRIQNHIHRLRPYGEVCVEYFYYVFYFLKNAGSINGKGIGIKGLSSNVLHSLAVPLPPLAEQKRIVSKIEELLPLLARYEQAWTKLEAFNTRFPSDLQKSLLQLAIQGKLVEQRPEEGTGEDLYREILATKNTKKSKKEKPLPEIAEDEIPFDIPESWKWVRLGTLGELKSGYAFKSAEYTKDGIQVVRISDLEDDAIGAKDAVFYPRKDELSSYFIVNGSFLICMTGSIGKMAWVKDGVLRYLNQRVGMFIPTALCSPAYIWFFLHTSHVISGWIRAKTSANGNIKNADITELLTPLPPLAEQKRIVAKLEELLPLCKWFL